MKRKIKFKFKYEKEFEGKIFDINVAPIFSDEKRVIPLPYLQEILVKDFVRKKEYIRETTEATSNANYCLLNHIKKQKVKEAIDKLKRMTITFKNYGIIESYLDAGDKHMIPLESLKKELGLK